MVDLKMMLKTIKTGLLLKFLFFSPLVIAQEYSEVDVLREETKYIFDSFLFLGSAILVMFMIAGFGLREAGYVRAKNAATICVKTICSYAIAATMVWMLGYHLIYSIEPGGYLGAFKRWGAEINLEQASYSIQASWFFQMAVVAICASIVSGAIAERIRLWPYLIFVVVLTGLIYPIAASWHWGGGWLEQFGFIDFAGATLVHSVGGWAALCGAIFLGPRHGRYREGLVRSMAGSNLPLATLGTFLVWIGWFGFTGGAQLALGSVEDIRQISKIFVNTNIAACGGVLCVLATTQFLHKKIELPLLLNGAIGGLVAISADPFSPAIWQALFIGAIGGVIVAISGPLLDRLKIDDVVGAIPVHLLCGIWGTLVVPMANSEANLPAQLVGIFAIGAFSLVMSFLVWTVLKYSMGIRVSTAAERLGLDESELGLEAYPEFITK